MINEYKTLTNALSKKGSVVINPTKCSNKVFLFIEKNSEILDTVPSEDGLLTISLKCKDMLDFSKK